MDQMEAPPSSQEYDFDFSTSKKWFTAGENYDFAFSVTNASTEPVHFNNDKRIPAGDYPDIDEKLTNGFPPGIYLYFVYGDEAGAMTSVEKSQAYIVARGGESKWSVDYGESKSKGRYWILAPGITFDMPGLAAESFSIKNLTCNNRAGSARLYINIKIRHDREINCNVVLDKCNAPKILKFKPTARQYNPGDVICFHWETSGATSCTLDGAPATPVDMGDLNMSADSHNHILVAANVAGSTVRREYTAPYVSIKDFAFTGNGGRNRVEVRWDTEKFDSVKLSDCPDALPAGGTRMLTVAADKDIALTCTRKVDDEDEIGEKKLAFKMPVIASFAKSNAAAIPVPDPQNAPDGFIAPEQLEALGGVPLVAPPYAAPGPGPRPPTPKIPVTLTWTTTNATRCNLRVTVDGAEQTIACAASGTWSGTVDRTRAMLEAYSSTGCSAIEYCAL